MPIKTTPASAVRDRFKPAEKGKAALDMEAARSALVQSFNEVCHRPPPVPEHGDNELVFVLPLPPNLANGRFHWRDLDVLKHDYADYFVYLATSRRLPQLKTPWPRVVIHAHFAIRNGKMDDDGLVSRLKWPRDLIVRSGVVADDDPEHVTLGTLTQERVSGPGWVIVRIERQEVKP